jgi:hypothetical protein
MLIEHPTPLASEIAHVLRNDPIMARQIKEHIKPAELVELLELSNTKEIECINEDETRQAVIETTNRAQVLRFHREGE